MASCLTIFITNLLTSPPPRELETPLLIPFARCSAGDGGFSRADQAVQPEDKIVLFISPMKYLLEKVDAGTWEAGGLVLSSERVVWRIIGVR